MGWGEERHVWSRGLGAVEMYGKGDGGLEGECDAQLETDAALSREVERFKVRV